MTRELLVSAASGLTVFALGRVLNGVSIGLWGNTDRSTLDVYNSANFDQYVITMVELGVSGFYEADMPEFFSAENVRAVEVIFYSQLGATAVSSDTKLSASLYELIDDWVSTRTLTV